MSVGPSPAFLQALQAYKQGDLRACLDRLHPLLKKRPPDANMLLVAAQCHAKLEEKLQAAALYAQVADLQPQNRRMFLLMAARLYMQADQGEQALSLIRKMPEYQNLESQHLASLDPEEQRTYRRLLRGQLCLEEIEASDNALLAAMREGADPAFFNIDDPYQHMLWCDDEAINGRQTRMANGKPFMEQSRQARRSLPHRFGEKIRVGYLSSDFSDQHPTMRLLQSVLLGHDAARFDIHLFCHTPEDIRGLDRGLRQTYPNLHDILSMDDATARDFIRSFDLDILVDLKGHTKDVRADLINSGLARLQVAYLGFPGSAYGIDCDYVISDPIVTPNSSKPHYHEKLCRLPETYQANDNRYRPLPPATSRSLLDLPEDAFVLASFNMVRKISPQTARLWARLLDAIPSSILWVLCAGREQRDRLAAFMSRCGIDRSRLYFTGAESYAPHIARMQAADLGLDTYPYNGHTTTSDKLWAGLPVITFKGSNFASRVSESLLTALGVPQLVAETPDDMVRLAAALAQDRPRLAALRQMIGDNRLRAPLFDTQRFTRHLEQAFEMMVEREKAGLEPDHINVPALPSRQEPFRQNTD
ncbi:hypothetical protein V6582_18515 [Agrobacterium vitis]|uniref:O-linked N-acetylglucosamine transferase family protein n=1 Tax=Agrobacterium vitis TaxID=373 RepID=UPI0012E8F031|nr:hypothetical protein [Agrobacterium vitis]